MGDKRTPIAEHSDGWRKIVHSRGAAKTALRLRGLAVVENLLQRAISHLK